MFTSVSQSWILVSIRLSLYQTLTEPERKVELLETGARIDVSGTSGEVISVWAPGDTRCTSHNNRSMKNAILSVHRKPLIEPIIITFLLWTNISINNAWDIQEARKTEK